MVNTLNELDDPPVEFSAADWKKMKQIIHVLQIFKDATLKLSFHDASISMAIPIVTSIITTLSKETSEDVGVLGMKRDLRKAMETRFSDMEYKEQYAISTILDGKYKRYFFRDSDAFYRAKATLVLKLVDALREDSNTEVIVITKQVCKTVCSDIPSAMLGSRQNIFKHSLGNLFSMYVMA